MRGEKSTDMADLEKQFLALKEQLYYERLSQVEHKLDEVKAGRAQEYLQPLEELQEIMSYRTEVAAVLRELKLTNVQCQHDAEMLAARQNKEVSWPLDLMEVTCNSLTINYVQFFRANHVY